MKNSTISKQWSNTTDLYSTNAYKSHKLSMLWLMLLTLLLLPTRMVAQTYPAYAEYDNATRTLTFKCDPSKPDGAYELNVGNNTPGWLAKRSKIEKVVFDASFANARPTSCYGWFVDCYCLTKIEGIENLNTESVEDMSYMFVNCNSLSSLTLSKSFNTASVLDMASMFSDCYNLSSLDISNFNTAKVENMAYMFYNCQSLSSLALSKFNTANVKDMAYMFYNCRSLSSLNLSNFNTANVEDMAYMFYNCNKLSSLNVTNFNTANVTDMEHMFYSCSKLSSLDLTNFNTAKVKNMRSMFWNCSALTTIYVSDKFVTGQVTSGSDMFLYCSNLKGYSDSKIDHTYANCDPDGYFTPGCAYAEYDNATETLTFKCGLSKPAGAYDLNEGDNTPKWRKEPEDGSFVPGEKINISKVVFDASFANARPTSCYHWFDGCTNLTQIEGIKNLNTEEVTNMGFMFWGCFNLTTLDVSNFNTQKVEYMRNMFASCGKLKSLSVSNFNTQKVKDMTQMFHNCNSLTSLDVSNFNTQNVEKMSYMFSWCEGLNSLDLSKFDTQNVTNMSNMFQNSSALKTIYVSDKFVTTEVSSGANMFKDCTNLKGFIEYNKNKDKDNYKYANYKTGYFTKLVVRNGNERYGITGETTQLTVDNLVLADGKDFVAYEPFTATAASYNRTMKEGTTWATLCLPFEVSLDGKNFRAFKLLSADEGTETVELEELKTIEAGTPVIIKMTNGATELKFTEADKNIAKDVQTAATADANYQLQGLYTHKEFSKDADNNCYIVKGNKLMNPAKLLENTKVTKVASKPFRAYMVDNSSSAPAGAKMFSIGISDSTTAIDTLNTIANDNAIYYDLQGKRLNEPQKGINIVKRNGKTMKVIIK
jgi:surface protein